MGFPSSSCQGTGTTGIKIWLGYCGAPHLDLSDTAVLEYGHARQHRLKPWERETNLGPRTVLSLVLIFSMIFPPKNQIESLLYQVLGENLLYHVQL